MQVRWIGLGVAVGLAPFLLLPVFPRVLGLASPLLSSVAVVPLGPHPARVRLRDPEVAALGRRDLRSRSARDDRGRCCWAGMTFVLLNTLLDRTFEGMAEAGKNVVAFGSGLVLAALLVPVKKRITGVLERIQYHDTYRARRALLDIARDFATPRAQEELVGRDRAARRGRPPRRPVLPLPLRGPGHVAAAAWDLLSRRLADRGRVAPARGRLRRGGRARARSTSTRRATASSSPCAARGNLVGALGVGHKDGRVPLSSEDEALLTAVMAQAGLAYENAAPLRGAGRAAGGDPQPRSSTRRASSGPPRRESSVLDARRPHAFGQPRLRGDRGPDRKRSCVGSIFAARAAGRRPAAAPADGGESAVEARFFNAARRGAGPARLGLGLPRASRTGASSSWTT